MRRSCERRTLSIKVKVRQKLIIALRATHRSLLNIGRRDKQTINFNKFVLFAECLHAHGDLNGTASNYI